MVFRKIFFQFAVPFALPCVAFTASASAQSSPQANDFAVFSDSAVSFGNSAIVTGPIASNGSVDLDERAEVLDVLLHGDFRSKNLAVMKGDITSTNGRIQIGINGTIQGNLDAAKDVYISAFRDITGDILAREGKVTITKNRNITGNVLASGEIKIGRDNSFVGNIASKTYVQIADRTEVRGTVTHPAGAYKQDGERSITHLSGSVSVPAKNDYKVQSFQVPVPNSSGANVVLDDKETLSLAPGNYGKLTLGRRSTLELRWGSYTFSDIQAEGEVNLRLDLRNDSAGQTLDIKSSGNALFGKKLRAKLVTDRSLIGDAASRIRLTSKGALGLGMDSIWYGTLVSNKSLRLAKNVTVTGSLFAHDKLAVGAYSSVDYVPFSAE